MFSFLPSFLRNGTFASMIIGTGGILTYTGYKQHLDKKLSHPLVKESILLLQNNEEVLKLIGVPITVEPTISTSATVKDDVAFFSFRVRGPRGKLTIEISGLGASLKDIGINAKGKAMIAKERKTNPKFMADPDTNEPLPIPENLDELNFNEYYLPDTSIVEDYYGLATKQTEPTTEDKRLDPDNVFWKYEYMFAEVDSDLRILVAPDQQLIDSQKPILQRSLLSDLNKEYKERMKSYNVLDKNLTKEEMEEFRKIKFNEHYRKIGYTRTYMMSGLIFLGMNAYIFFRKNKRYSLNGSNLAYGVQKAVLRNRKFQSFIPDTTKVKFMEGIIGAKIDNIGEYKQPFMTPKYGGWISTKGIFDEKTSTWSVNEINVEFVDAEGNPAAENIKISEKLSF